MEDLKKLPDAPVADQPQPQAPAPSVEPEPVLEPTEEEKTAAAAAAHKASIAASIEAEFQHLRAHTEEAMQHALKTAGSPAKAASQFWQRMKHHLWDKIHGS